MNTAVKRTPSSALAVMEQEASVFSVSCARKTAKGLILVVDDEPEIVKALTLRLKFHGYEVIAADDGARATQAAIRQQPNLIILDIGLPCGDGFEIARRLSSNVNTLHIPIIFLTARTGPMNEALAREAGGLDFITKPFTAERVLSAVTYALGSIGD